jgi:hypothetical protein
MGQRPHDFGLINVGTFNLTGDYHWRRDGGLRNRKLRPLQSQPLPTDFAALAYNFLQMEE